MLDLELMIINYINEHQKITTSEVKEILDLKDSRAREIIKNMVDSNKIKRLGSGRNTYYEVSND